MEISLPGYKVQEAKAQNYSVVRIWITPLKILCKIKAYLCVMLFTKLIFIVLKTNIYHAHFRPNNIPITIVYAVVMVTISTKHTRSRITEVTFNSEI